MNYQNWIDHEARNAEFERWRENMARFAPIITEKDLAAKRECEKMLEEQDEFGSTGGTVPS